MELMTRQLDGSGSPQLQHQVLTCLAPWMQNLSFAARWEGAAAHTISAVIALPLNLNNGECHAIPC